MLLGYFGLADCGLDVFDADSVLPTQHLEIAIAPPKLRHYEGVHRYLDSRQGGGSEMNLDPGYLLASMFVSGVGFVLFKYGRKQGRPPQVVLGLVMLVYPYFITDLTWMLGVLPLLLLLLWGLTRLGF
jgi:hypothetical protein